MICPKCQAKLRNEQTFTAGCAIHRTSGPAHNALITGMTCWSCGYWRDADVIPTVDYVPEPVKTAGVIRYDCGVKVAAYHIVIKFYDSIAAQRDAGTSWYAIARLLTQSGNRVLEKTLQKYFVREQLRRHEAAA